MFNFIRKLFKALNSSGKSWQLSAAVVLAMFAGFLPADTLILFVVLLIALVLNVNFGLFLLFSVIFGGIGYLFDPLFESIGYSVLMSEALNGFFTALYNSAIFRWTSFNYTLVTGSLIVSSVLALPMLLVLNRVVRIYRVQIGEKLNAWKVTRWMKLFNEEAKSSSVFRWWGLGVFGGLSAFILFVMLFVFDPLARIALEKSLSYALKTEVAIGSFHSSLSDLQIEIKGIEVSDRDKLTHNLVQMDTLSFDLGFSALLEKKAMIEHLNLSALAFDVKRDKPAEAYCSSDSAEARDAEKLKEREEVSAGTPFALPSVDDILAKEELKSVQEAQRLKADIQAAREKWEKTSAELKSADDVEQIKKDAKTLQESLKNADLSKIASAKQDIDALRSKIKALKDKYAKLQAEFNADQTRLQQQIAGLKELPSADIARLKQKYALNAGGGANMIGTLISREVGGYMNTALKYYAMLKPYISDAKTQTKEQTAPPRGEGRWIRYANLSTIPELLIKDAKVNVRLAEDEIDVKITDLSSNQKLYQKPMVLHADAKGTAYASIKADVIDDRRKERGRTSFDIKADGVKKASMDIQTLSMQEMRSDIDLKGTIIDKTIQAKSDVKVHKVKLSMPSQKFVNDMLEGISSFNAAVTVEGELETPSISVKTDLDKQLSKGLASMASKRGKKFEDELRAGVMKKASASSEGIALDLGDIGSLLDSKQDALSGINTDFASSKSNPLKGILPF